MPDSRLRWHGSATLADVICAPRGSQVCHDFSLVTIPNPGGAFGPELSPGALLYVSFHNQSSKAVSHYVRDGEGNSVAGSSSQQIAHPWAPFAQWYISIYKVGSVHWPLNIRFAWCHIGQIFADCDDVAVTMSACIVDEWQFDTPGLTNYGLIGGAGAFDTFDLQHDYQWILDSTRDQAGYMKVALMGCYLGAGQGFSNTNGWEEIENIAQVGGSRFCRTAIAVHNGNAIGDLSPYTAAPGFYYGPTLHTHQNTANRLGISIASWLTGVVPGQHQAASVKSSVQFIG